MPSRAACPNLPVPAQSKRPIRRVVTPSASLLGATRALRVTEMTYVTLQRFPFEPFDHDKKVTSSQIPPKRKMICSPCLLASSTKRYADDGACGWRARRAPHGSKTSRACWRCRCPGHAKAGVHACCADGLFHSARRHPRAPVWVHPPRGRLPQHLGQHLQEQGPHRLLRAAVRGKLCTSMLACSLVRLGILRAAAVHFIWRARGHASRTRHRPSQRGVEHIQEMDGSGGTFLVVHRRESPWLDLAFRACVKRFFSAWACNAMWRVPTVHFQRLDTAVAYIHHTIRR